MLQLRLPRLSLLLAMAFLWGAFFCAPVARAESGYDLWLRYHPLAPNQQAIVNSHIKRLYYGPEAAYLEASLIELQRAFTGFAGAPLAQAKTLDSGDLVLLTSKNTDLAHTLGLDLKSMGEEAYLIRTVPYHGGTITVIAANTDIGVLYGAFHLIAMIQTEKPIDNLNLNDQPGVQLRVLNHWDNLNGTVERGYAGHSLWNWWKLPDIKDQRLTDYARANASIGINGSVLNNVNAEAEMLTLPYLRKVKAIADTFRPYGIRVYLSVKFTSPQLIGGLPTSDPMDPQVRAWWRAKSDEIYALIPDFGGFLVKANSEGQPGPQDFGRTQAEGANMLAEAIGDRGTVIWRAFVYAADNRTDRAMQAYYEFKPLDGKFADTVLVQVKNGPIDFQPREPFHPLFGAMPKTNLMMEFQITKEYLGFSTHLAYLGPLYEEVLKADTFAKGKGSTVARVIDGSLDHHRRTGMAGVANIGSDINWTGSQFDQANWYVFGRMAWNPQADSRQVAAEWVARTFSNAQDFVEPVTDMMMHSREAVVNYMTPLGLAHLMGTGAHYGPAPWVSDLSRPEWNPTYYHRADKKGIGFDRSPKGSGATSLYARPVAQTFESVKVTPETYLLWFHHLPWTYRLRSGKTLWPALVNHYDQGVATVEQNQRQWEDLGHHIDAQRRQEIAENFAVQAREARWWRDASILYWQSINGLDLPKGAHKPEHDLDYYKHIHISHPPGSF